MDDLLDIARLNRKNSAWSNERTFAEMCTELENELRELEEANDKQDIENINEELGDVLWDLFNLFAIAEEKWGSDSSRIEAKIVEKVKRRKPWIFTDEKPTADEEVRRWKEAKVLEKSLKK